MKLLIHTVVFLCFLIALPSKANASFTQSIFFNALSIISEPLSITVQNNRNKRYNPVKDIDGLKKRFEKVGLIKE